MTVMTKYFNYQTAGKSSPFYGDGKSPNLDVLMDYLMHRYGGQDLGIFGIRPVVGGQSISTHASGAAMDWRYENPGPGRAVCLNEILPLLIDHSAELGIQFIGDYVGCRIWISDRVGTDWDRRWKPQARGTQMGQPWAQWLHIEVHPDHWDDDRTFEQKLGIADPDPSSGLPTMPILDLRNGEFGLFMLIPYGQAPKTLLRLGSKGQGVEYAQASLRFKLGYGVQVDGDYGPVTEANVRWFQSTHQLQADGIAGQQTMAAIDALHTV